MTETKPAGPRTGDRPDEHTQNPTVPDDADIAAILAKLPVRGLDDLLLAIEIALDDPDVDMYDTRDLRAVLPVVRIVLRRRRTEARIASARRMLAANGLPWITGGDR